MSAIDLLLNPWARATLRRLFVGDVPWWAMPGGWLRRQVGRDDRVADTWYALADYDRAAGDGLYPTPTDADRALRVRGFKTRALAYFEGHGAPSRAPALGALVVACAALALVVLPSSTPTPSGPGGGDVFMPRGPDADASLHVDMLCLNADGELIARAAVNTTPCPIGGVAQPVVTDEAAAQRYVAVFIVQPGTDARVTPMVPNPGETAAVRLDAIGTEQRVGPARRLAVNYTPGAGHAVFVVDDEPLPWARVRAMLDRTTATLSVPGPPPIDDAVRSAFITTFGRAPHAIRVHRFDLAPDAP